MSTLSQNSKARKPRTQRVSEQLQEAADPTTPADYLQQLANEVDDPPILAAIARNPNTPLPVLAKLLNTYSEHVEAFLENPIAPFLVIEEPGFFNTVSALPLKTILRNADLSPLIVSALTGHPDETVATTARLHIAFAGEAGDDWQDEARKLLLILPSENTGWFLGERNDLLVGLAVLGMAPRFVVEYLSASADGRVRQKIRQHNLLPEDDPLRVLLVRASGSADLSEVTDNFDPDIDPKDLAYLAAGGPFWRFLAIRHPATPPDTLRQLAQTGDTGIQVLIARNPSAPPDILWELLREGNERVCLSLPRNPNLPGELLLELTKHRNAAVRAAALRHPAIPAEQLSESANDPDVEVRVAVALNPNTPEAARQKLAEDTAPALRRATKIALSAQSASKKEPISPLLPEKQASDTHLEEKKSLIETIPQLDPDQDPLDLLKSVREAPRTDRILLYKALLMRKDLTDDVLMRIWDEAAQHLHPFVMQNPQNFADNIFRFFLKQWLNENFRHQVPLIRVLALLNDLVDGADDKSWTISYEWQDRFAAVLRRTTRRDEVVERANNDGNRLVRAAARWRLENPDAPFIL